MRPNSSSHSAELPTPLSPYTGAVRRVEKPWGYELIYAVTEDYCGKLLHVRAGEALSLQFHERKDETIYLLCGSAWMEIGSNGDGLQREIIGPGRAFRIRPGVVHRMRAVEDATFLEVSTPELDDVVRLEDRYGRASDEKAVVPPAA